MTYVYECKVCDHVFETEQRITDPAGAECPACHAHTKRRLIQPSAFQLKGGNWARDGYGGK